MVQAFAANGQEQIQGESTFTYPAPSGVLKSYVTGTG